MRFVPTFQLSVVLFTLAAAPLAAYAAAPAPFAARAGVDLAASAAHTWAEDAQLVYLENDEALVGAGTAPRWGYLFYSPSLGRARAWSLRAGRIVAAETLPQRFAAPALHPQWCDSDSAVAIADREAARSFAHGATPHVAHMVLARGAFSDRDPDPTSWTIVYEAAGAPALFVMVDARTGAVRRSWRG